MGKLRHIKIQQVGPGHSVSKGEQGFPDMQTGFRACICSYTRSGFIFFLYPVHRSAQLHSFLVLQTAHLNVLISVVSWGFLHE